MILVRAEDVAAIIGANWGDIPLQHTSESMYEITLL